MHNVLNSEIDPLKEKSRSSSVIFILLLVASFPGLLWIKLDHEVWPWDPAWYGQVTLDLYEASSSSFTGGWQAMLLAFGFKAPGLAWIGQLFVWPGLMYGSVEKVLLLYVLGTVTLSAMLLAWTFRRLQPSTSGIAITFASLSFLAAPLLSGLSHQYFVEPMQALSIVLVLALCVSRLSSLELIAASIGCASFSLLAKSTSPLYLLAPALFLLVEVWRRRAIACRPFRCLIIQTLSALVTFACASWYIKNGQVLFDFMAKASSGEYAGLYGKDAPFFAALSFWLDQALLAFFAHYWLLAAFSLFFLLAIIIRIRSRKSLDRLDVLVLMALLQIGLVISFFATQINRETRYLCPLVPYVAVLMFFTLHYLGKLALLPGILILLQWGAVNTYQLGVLPIDGLAKSPWLKAVNTDLSNVTRIRALVYATCNEEFKFRYHIVGLELPSFNANSAAFFASQYRVQLKLPFTCYYTSLGYAEADFEKAWQRVLDMNTATFSFLGGYQARAGDPFNAVSSKALDRIASLPLSKNLAPKETPDLLIYTIPPKG